MKQWRLFFSSRMRWRFCCFVKTEWDMSLWLRYTVKCLRDCNRSHGLDLLITKICRLCFICLNIFKSGLRKWVDYHYFHLQIYRLRPIVRRRASLKIMTEETYVMLFISLLSASVRTVYRVENCSPRGVIHKFLWASNFESSFITKFEYSRTCRDSIISLVYTAGHMRKHSLILTTIEQKSC